MPALRSVRRSAERAGPGPLEHLSFAVKDIYDIAGYATGCGNPEWLTTVTFEENPEGTLVTHTIQHKSREVRDAHLQAGMEQGMVQTLTRLNEHTAAMEQAQ